MYDLQELLHTARRNGDLPPGLLDQARASKDKATLAAAHVIHGICAGLAFDLDACFHHCDEAIALYEALPFDQLDGAGVALHRQFLWSAHTTRGIYLDDLGRLAESVAEHRLALRLARDTAYERGQVVSMSNLCEELLRSGDVTEATFHLLQPGVDHGTPLEPSLLRIRSESMALLYHASGLEAESLSHMRYILDYEEATEDHDSLKLMAQLAFVEASHARVAECQELLNRIDSSSVAVDFHRVQSAVTLARARLLAESGEIDQALTLVDLVDDSMVAEKEFEDLAHPLVARIEILATGGRIEEALAAAESWPYPISQISLSHIYRLRGRLLADLARWEESLAAVRQAEEHRQKFDLDVARYVDLSFPGDTRGESQAPAAGSLVDPARGAKLRRILSHDIRGLFTPVQLAFDTAHLQNDPDEYRTRLRALLSLVDRMRDTPENVASYLMLVEGEADSELATVSVADTVDHVLRRFALEARQKGISIRRTSSPEVSVWADPKMLTASLNNLVSNALKFTPHLGSITVGWRYLPAQRGIVPALVEIGVADQGPGLTAEERDQVFRQTRTWSARPTAGESSTGIGLQIVTGFVNAMHGEVRAESSEDGGARFVLSFRAADDDHALLPPESADAPAVARSSGPRSLRPDHVGPHGAGKGQALPAVEPGGQDEPRFEVLLFDDDPMVLAVITEMLEPIGAHVRATGDYAEAYTLLTGPTTFQLCIFDVMINGVALGRQLSTLAATLFPNTTIVVMTGTDISFDEREFRHAMFVRKPVGYHQIADLVTNQIGDYRQLVAEARRDEPSLQTTEAGRIRLLFEIVQGRELPKGWAIPTGDEDDKAQAIDTLILFCVYEATQGRPEAAIDHGTEALALVDKTGIERPVELLWHLHDSLGVAHFESGRHDQALSWHEAAFALAERANYEHGECRSAIRLAAVHTKAGHSETAIGVLASAIERVSTDPSSRAQVFAQLGQQLLTQGASNLAVAQLRRALDNFSPLELDRTRRTLQLLAQGYLDTGDLASLEVILGRLRRLGDALDPAATDQGFDDTMRAAICLARSDWDQALVLAQRAVDSAIGRSHLDTLWAPMAFATLVDAQNKLGRHREVVERWRDPASVPDQLRGQQAFLNIALSCEAMGDFEGAVANQLEAYRRRSHRNLGLPRLITLTETLLEQVEQSIRESDPDTDLVERDARELRQSIDEILQGINNLRELIVDAIDEPEGRSPAREETMRARLQELKNAVVNLNREGHDGSSPDGTGTGAAHLRGLRLSPA